MKWIRRSGGLLKSVSQTYRELGLFNATLYCLDRLASTSTAGRLRIRRYMLVVQPLHSSADARRPHRTSISIKSMSELDLSDLDFPVPLSELQRRLDMGSHCLVAQMNGQFAGYLWYHLGAYEEDEVRCIFEPSPAKRVCWDYDVYVHPRYRTTRVFARLWSAAAAQLYPQGITHSASRISAYNAHSLRAHASSGNRRRGSAIFLTWRKRQIAMTFLGSPRVFFSSNPLPRIRIALPDTVESS